MDRGEVRMSVKKDLIEILEKNKGTSISGQQLAECLSVSRTAVWKAIRSLQEDGYKIEAVTNKGYCLKEESDILSEEGAEEGTLILAEEQSQGRGRLGRGFASPSQTGIYMSLILKPSLEMKDAVLITTAAAVAVCRAIQKITGMSPWIKWVNDIFLGERKICGILTEAVSDFETGLVESVVLGIGINVKTKREQFPKEVQDVAGSLNVDSIISRNVLVAAVTNEFMYIYHNIEEREYMKDYRKFSNVLGEQVKYLEKGTWYYAKAVDIDDNGGLIVENQAGERRTLCTGEITLRKVEK